MRILFIHQNFPAQFRFIANRLSQTPGVEVGVVTADTNRQPQPIPLTEIYQFAPKIPPGLSSEMGFILTRFWRAEAAAAAMLRLRNRGFTPDVVVGHPGWGETIYVNDIFPKARFIAHAEFFYSAEGADVGFDPEFPPPDDKLRMALKAKNQPLLTALADCTRAVAPTIWQGSRVPPEFKAKMTVLHEGINTETVTPNPKAEFAVDGHPPFRAGDEVITFVNRNLEPLRGYHIFMRALPRILEARPNAHVVLIGGTGVSYSSQPPQGTTWKDLYFNEVRTGLPLDRVHFVGQVPYARFLALMQVSALHVYLTYPFVLSWSMLEAMSAGAVVLGSATPPVTEFIDDGKNGILFDFFDVDGLAEKAISVLKSPESHRQIRVEARKSIIARCDLRQISLPAWLGLIETIAAGAR